MFALVRSTRLLIALAALVATGTVATLTVEIAPGDTLSEIAARHGVTVSALVDWNDIADADFILAGDTLVIRTDAADGSTETYIVKAGDTLSELAGRFGTTVGAMVAANGLADPDLIVIGQVLNLAGDLAEEGSAPGSNSTSYVVKAGDTLLAIARANGLKTSDLLEVNEIADPDRIFVGQLLTIPQGPSAPVSPPTTVPPTSTTTVPATTTTTIAPAPTPTVPPTTSVPTPGSSTALVGYFERWSAAYGVDQSLLEALLWKESNWRVDAVGPGGHLGIGQLHPDTVEFIEQRLLGLDLDPLDASDGIRMAARFLRYLLDRTDSERTALAAWNQGLHSVNTNGISAAAGAFADEVLEIRRHRR